MNNKYYNQSSVKALIDLFSTSPETAYNNAVSSGIYLHPKHGQSFWALYKKIDHAALAERFTEQAWIFHKLGKLHLFWSLIQTYQKHIEDCEKALFKLNPTADSLLKSLFLVLELGNTPRGSYDLPAYSKESLSAIKEIYTRFTKGYNPDEKQTSYSLELFNTVKFLLMLRIDLISIKELVDLCTWADYDIEQLGEKRGYLVSYPSELSKANNVYVLEILKSQYKNNQLRQESQALLSSEQHFKVIDPQLKTNEGLAVVFHSSGIKTESTGEGLTSIQVDDQLFKNMESQDEAVRSKGFVEMMYTALNQSFHYNYRQALASVYQPKEAQELHKLRITLPPGNEVSLYELFCIVSCLYGITDNYRYSRQLPGTEGIALFKQMLVGEIKCQRPEMKVESIIDEADQAIANHFSEIDKTKQPFDILPKEGLLNHLHRIEELKQKSDEELLSVIDFLASANNRLPYNPLYKLGENYILQHQVYSTVDVNRMLYDHFITQNLYSINGKSADSQESKRVNVLQKIRSQTMSLEVERLLSQLTNFTGSDVEFPGEQEKYRIEKLKGDIDAIGYFDSENIIIPIQIKLSNTTIIQERGKAIWVHDHIYGKGQDQVEKDLKLLNLKNGQKLIANRLGITDPQKLAKAKICPLIITDNFYADHYSFTAGTDHTLVYCISLFELKCLISGIRINAKQALWPSLQNNKSAALLLNLIKENVFWSFLSEEANNFKTTKELKVIDPNNRVRFEA